MGIFNRRNAAVGWLTWTVGKRVLKKKAKSAVPVIKSESKKPGKGAIALAAGIVGALTFWRKRSGDDDPPPEA